MEGIGKVWWAHAATSSSRGSLGSSTGTAAEQRALLEPQHLQSPEPAWPSVWLGLLNERWPPLSAVPTTACTISVLAYAYMPYNMRHGLECNYTDFLQLLAPHSLYPAVCLQCAYMKLIMAHGSVY